MACNYIWFMEADLVNTPPISLRFVVDILNYLLGFIKQLFDWGGAALSGTGRNQETRTENSTLNKQNNELK